MIFETYCVVNQLLTINDKINIIPVLLSSNTCYLAYRYYYNDSVCNYVYEPVDRSNFEFSIAKIDSDFYITYMYTFLATYGYCLVPIGYSGPSKNILKIKNYEYCPITLNCKEVWIYKYCCTNNLPCNSLTICQLSLPNIPPTISPSQPGNTIGITSFQRLSLDNEAKINIYDYDLFSEENKLTFTYEPVSINNTIKDYNLVNSKNIDQFSDITKMPMSINSDNTTNIGNGYAYIIPDNSSRYQISFSCELRINTTNKLFYPNNYPSIQYLKGSGNVAAEPAIAQLIIYEIDDDDNVAINMIPTALQHITWADMCLIDTDGEISESNFKIFENSDGKYYKTNEKINIIYDILPVDNVKTRLFSIIVTSGFPFYKINVTFKKF